MLLRRVILSKYAVYDRRIRNFIFHCEEIEHLGWFARGAIEAGYEIGAHFHIVARATFNDNYCTIIDYMLDEIAIIEDEQNENY